MNCKRFTIVFVLCFNFGTIICQQQNHIYASTRELSVLQQKFVKFLKIFRHQNFKILEDLNVENPVHGYVFLRSILTDYSDELFRFKKRLEESQVNQVMQVLFYNLAALSHNK